MTELTPFSTVASATTPLRPRLRGWLHVAVFPLALAAGIVLICLAPSPGDAAACAVFAVSSWLLFGVSGIYHTRRWGPRWKSILRRFDHTNIFLIIAGTYTPVSVTLLPRGDAELLLCLVWGGALIGIGFRMFWLTAPRWVYVPCYVALGWAAVLFLPQLLHGGGPGVVALIVAGGVLYSAGAVVYALKRPDFSPRWFGFHELFHAFTIAAFCCHYSAVAISVLSGPTNAG